MLSHVVATMSKPTITRFGVSSNSLTIGQLKKHSWLQFKEIIDWQSKDKCESVMLIVNKNCLQKSGQVQLDKV